MPTDRLQHSTRRRTLRLVEKEDITAAVDAWLPALGLPDAPAAGVKDLKDRRIRVAKFTDEETSRFFFPRRTLVFQQRMNRELALRLRRRGARIVSVPIMIEDYARWQQSQEEPDSPELRYRFATVPPLELTAPDS